MKELLDAAVSPANIIITGLLIFILLYWITVILGVIDLDAVDFDVDVDVDADVDIDADVDASGVSWFNSVLAFFNLGHVPFMVFMTCWIVPAWAICIIANDKLGISSFGVGLGIMAGGLFASLFIAKIATQPFVRIFAKIDQEAKENQRIRGKICTVTIGTTATSTGQATINTSGAPLLINVRTSEGVEMQKGDTGLVLELIDNQNIYLIEPFND
ncbi:MAG: hypothetical protein AAGI38_09790 [Bacteroidota bacterium]